MDGIAISKKNHTTTLLLAIFLGGLGIHRYYVGKTGTGVLWMLTCGLVGVGWFVDVIFILSSCFEDWDGALVLSERAQKKAAKSDFAPSRLAEILTWIVVALMGAFLVCELAAIIVNMAFPYSDFAASFPPWFVAIGLSGVLYSGVFAWALSAKL